MYHYYPAHMRKG